MYRVVITAFFQLMQESARDKATALHYITLVRLLILQVLIKNNLN